MTHRVAGMLFVLALAGCAGVGKRDVDPNTVSTLAECPSSPNCVCSTDTGSHQIKPLAASNDVDAAWQALRKFLDEEQSMAIVASSDHYIRAEAKTRILRFTDDVEFLLNREAGVIDMRSASRIGYSDLGKNRSRLEGVRATLKAAGVIEG